MLVFAEAPSSQWMLFAAGACLGVWLLLRRPFKNRIEPPATKANKQESKSSITHLGLMDSPQELARWEVALHETARDLKAELDSKMVALQALVAIAQHETERLNAAVTRAERLGISATRDSLAALERATEAAAMPIVYEIEAPPQVALPLPEKLRERIYLQADEGHSPSSIAATVGLPIGDIEWTLHLRNRTQS